MSDPVAVETPPVSAVEAGSPYGIVQRPKIAKRPSSSTTELPKMPLSEAITMLHVYDDRIVHTVIPIPEAPEVSGQPGSMRALLDALSPEERREIISRKDSDFNTGPRDPLTDL